MKPSPIILLLSFSISVMPLSVNAELHHKGVNADHRIQRVAYDENNVVKLNCHYGYQTDIVFKDGEEIQNVALGDSLSWQTVPTQNHLFVKPMAASKTNMTVLTNKHSYHFQLQSTLAENSNQVFKLAFYYPQENSEEAIGMVTNKKSLSPLEVNWKYSYTGNKATAPIQAFDNGEFTYFKFRQDGMSRLPAIFTVGEDRRETLVNYHMEGDYIVINRVAKQLSLRDGKRVACVYNDFAIGDWQKMQTRG